MAEIKVQVPAKIRIENTSTRAMSFAPYRENFASVLAAGKAIEFSVDRAGQVLYYLKQATPELVVKQITNFTASDGNTTVLETPAIMTLENKSELVKSFQPYKENFIVDVKGGDKYEIEVSTLGQILYYLAQGTADLTVTYAKKAQA